MRVLITGARGNFATALLRLLDAGGCDLVLMDYEPMEMGRHKVVQADIRDAGAVVEAMRGCDAVIHAAGYHDVLLERRNDHDFYEVNVTGTHNVLMAMLRLGVQNLVFSSTDHVYGAGVKGHRTIDESLQCIPTQVHGHTKWLGEQMCAYYAHNHQMRVAILRYGSFVPGDWKQDGVGRLNNHMDRDDAAMANELALGALMNEEFQSETFLIQSAKPFVDSDWPDLAVDPVRIVESYWPGSIELLHMHSIRLPRILHRYDISKAREMLGYEPQHNFDQFLARLRREV